jgi:carbonic anhydrase
MQISRRAFLDAAAGLGGLTSLLAAPAVQPPTADQVHRELVQGNLRFASGHARHPHSSPARVRRTSRLGQHPHAAVLCCSDSRVAPEILFDQGIGDLFTVRVAGNVVNEDELASIEYAVEHLSVPLCVVLGHSSCGAVTAVVEGETLPVELDHLVVHIREAHEQTKQRFPNLPRQELIKTTVRANVVRAMEGLRSGPQVLRDRVERGILRIEGGVYDLDTGRVSWINPN